MSQEPQGISDLEPFIIALEKIGHKDLAIQCLDAFAESASLFGQHDNFHKIKFIFVFCTDFYVFLYFTVIFKTILKIINK